MRYVEFRETIEKELRRHPEGRTWVDLKERLALPYQRPCPRWTADLEREIGLRRVKGEGRALVWRLEGGIDR